MFANKKRPGLRSRFMSAALRRKTNKHFTEGPIDFPGTRKTMDEQNAGRKYSEHVCVESVDSAGVKGEWQVPKTAPNDTCIYYMHGGGYTVGSPESHRAMTTGLAEMTNTKVFSLDYRLSPEYSFPAPLDDALKAYHWLVESGLTADKIIFAGDSAGGGLVLALIHKLKALGAALPNAAVLMSPWTDLTLSGESIKTNRKTCAMLNDLILESCTEAYLKGDDPTNIFASPLLGDFSDFPPLLIYASSTEALLDDSRRLAEKADTSGVEVLLSVWNKQPHAWPIFYPFVPEAKHCLVEMSDFIQERLAC